MNIVGQYENSNIFNTWNTSEPLHKDSENPNVDYWKENSMDNFYNTNMNFAYISGYTGCNADTERNLSQLPFNTLDSEVPKNNLHGWHQTDNYPNFFEHDSLEALFTLCSESNNSKSEDNLSRKCNENFTDNERYFASIDNSQNFIEQFSLTTDSNSLKYSSSSANYVNDISTSVTKHCNEFTNESNCLKQYSEDNSISPGVSSTAVKASKSKRRRTVFTKSQLKSLNDAFAQGHYLTRSATSSLAQCLGLTENRVSVWFQNKRASWKKQNRSHINQANWKSSQNRKLGKSNTRKLESCKEDITNPSRTYDIYASDENLSHFFESPESDFEKNYTHIRPIKRCQQEESWFEPQKIQHETSFVYPFRYPANVYFS